MRTDYTFVQFKPGRTASWWSVAEDLLWPEKRVKDKIKRRADALAEAKVETVIQFGFHCRFDFAWYFGAIHGYFAEIADTLHERNIKFLDHYSCNIIARPENEAERIKYHSFQRHHVDLYPDKFAAETAGYAGYRFNDLREIDILTGKRAYTSTYQAEIFCQNNPGFLAMHEAYLKRQLSEIRMDGLQQDDMAFYNYFRSCGCHYCRERFHREYGHELPPVTDKSFWGDTSLHPTMWGNYENPAFLDWVQMRYRSISEHLEMVRRVLGPDRILMTCCSSSGPQLLNSLALSYEHFIECCDWVMLENCGLGAGTVNWRKMEPEAMLHKSIGFSKSAKEAPALACSYALYEDGAYLGWAISKFWGVHNWISTLTQGIIEAANDVQEESILIKAYNRWEIEFESSDAGNDPVELQLAFIRANKENGRKNSNGQEYWQRMAQWALALMERNIGYRFALSGNLVKTEIMNFIDAPLILDACACLSELEFDSIRSFLKNGGQAWITPPFASHDHDNRPRCLNLLAELQNEFPGVRLMPQEDVPELLDGIISKGGFSPLINMAGPNMDWKIRLRLHSGRLTIHLLNTALEGIGHKVAMDRWGREKVLHKIKSKASTEPLIFELDIERLGCPDFKPCLFSPELSSGRKVNMQTISKNCVRFCVDLSGIRLYALMK